MTKYYIVFSVFLTTLCIEAISLLALSGLEMQYSIRYNPVDALTMEHREILERFLEQDSSYIKIDSVLGWAPRPNGRTGIYQANAQGIRGVEDYSKKTGKSLRISAYGDSFTHGNEVRYDETWQQKMEQQDTSLEVLNFGVGGYGLDQAYLRYLKERGVYKSDIVLIGYMTDDIYRHQNIFRPFFSAKTGLPFGKPRFELQDDSLILDKNPFPTTRHYRQLLKSPGYYLRKAGKMDVYYQKAQKSGPLDFLASVRLFKIALEKVGDRFDTDFKLNQVYAKNSSSFKVVCRLFSGFIKAVKEDEAMPVIILFPNKRDVMRFKQSGENHFRSLHRYFDEQGFTYLDLLPVFAQVESDSALNTLFENHYTPEGNGFFAESILQFLKSTGRNQAR